MSNGTAIYRILGLAPQATPDEIKAAYHRQALERHPDRNPGDPEAADRFGKIKTAYDLLSDPGRRREWHRRHGLPPPGGGVRATAPPPPPRDESLDLVCCDCDGPVRECSVCGAGVCRHMAARVPGRPLEVACLPCVVQATELERRGRKLARMFRGRP